MVTDKENQVGEGTSRCHNGNLFKLKEQQMK